MVFTQSFIAFLLLFFISCQALASDFDKGLEQMREGNYAMAYCLWEPLARLGHPDAQYNLGWLYANGNGMNVDVNRAVYWWQQAAKNNYLDAQFAIGLAYTTGEGIKADPHAAFIWFMKAANGGHADARDIVKRLVLESGNDYYEQYPELKKVAWLIQSVVVKSDAVNIRSGPGTSNKVLYKARKDEVLKQISKKNDWLEIIFKNEDGQENSGWIHSKLVKTL